MRRLAPPPNIDLPTWAERYRRLSPENSAEPGRWDNNRAAYQVDMMRSLTDPRVERVVLMTSARVGKTQACINNFVGYAASIDPGNILVVLPTETRADEWAEDELDPLLRDTPILRGVFGTRKSRTAKDRRKHRSFPGGRLYVVGANAPSALAAKTIRYLLCDEIDRFPPSAGGEGDVVSLAERRANTVWNRKIVLSSTPTTAGSSRIEKAFEESDKRRYWVPCPDCGEMQVLRWQQVRWDGEEASTALYHCVECGSGWNDAQRWAAVRGGEWRAEAPFRGTAGFAVNELVSPWRRLAETAKDFLAAKRGGVETMRVWVNTAMGETWQERGEAPDHERLIERREAFPLGTVPAGAIVLTAGVDVQRDRLECDIWGWGPGYESWLVESTALHGDPAAQDVWSDLRDLLDRTWPSADGDPVRVAKVGVDTGGTDTQATYRALRAWADPRVVPLKGVDGWNRSVPVSGPTNVDVTADGRKLKRGLKLWTVAVSTLKAEFYRLLWLSRGDGVGYPPGWVHLPEGLDAEAVKQMVAEQLVTVNDRRGFARQEWRKLRDRNERLDCRNYARAALSVLGADRYGDRFWTMWRRPAPAVADPLPVVTPAAALEAPPATPVPRPPVPPASPAPAAPVRRVGRSGYLGRIGR